MEQFFDFDRDVTGNIGSATLEHRKFRRALPRHLPLTA
jgi:hypothetical protein